MDKSNPLFAFIQAACAPRDASHASGTLELAKSLLAARPDLASSDIHSAAILGDDAAVRRFIAADPSSATAKGGPYDWDALTHLCFSRYLRLDPGRSAAFVRAAAALLDAGASASTGWFEPDHQPKPEWESVIYGAAGLAQNADLTRLLLEHGADPNDGETPYHVPESYDLAAMKVLVESGRLSSDSLATMLLRKSDWHDLQGIKYLLEHGADPNRMTHWGFTALHQALRRDNSLKIIEAMLDQKADPSLLTRQEALSAVSIAARRGRGDVLEVISQRGLPIELPGADRLIASCARNDAATVRLIAETEPLLVQDLIAEGGNLLTRFAGNNNIEGIRHLLDLGVPVNAVCTDPDPYFDIAKESTALHVAAWRGWHATVRFLIDEGSPVNALDAKSRTPLSLAVKACIASHWTSRRSPDSVAALLNAGSSPQEFTSPTGYAEIDDLLSLK